MARGASRTTSSAVERMLPTRRSSPSVESTATSSRQELAIVPMKPLVRMSRYSPPAPMLPVPSTLITRVSPSGAVESMAAIRMLLPASIRPKSNVLSISGAFTCDATSRPDSSGVVMPAG